MVTSSRSTTGSDRVVVFACGNADRGDDAVAARSVEHLRLQADGAVEVRISDAIEPDELARLSPGERVVIVDAVSGVSPGSIVMSDLRDIDRLGPVMQASSTHQLPLPQVVGLASVLRGVPLEGRFIGIGIENVEPGHDLSPAVLAGLPALRQTIDIVTEELAAGDDRRRAEPR